MRRRNVWLAIVSAFLGPLVGSLTFIVAASAIDALVYGTAPMSNFLIENWPAVLSAGYVFGVLPGLVFAIVMMILSPRIAKLAIRLLVAAGAGAAITVVLLSMTVFGATLANIDLAILAALGLTGAVAGLVSLVITESIHPLPAAS